LDEDLRDQERQMTTAQVLPNGRLLVPFRAEGPNGLIGDGMVEIGPEDPTFSEWADFLNHRSAVIDGDDDAVAPGD
jgi:hypothetical protein